MNIHYYGALSWRRNRAPTELLLLVKSFLEILVSVLQGPLMNRPDTRITYSIYPTEDAETMARGETADPPHAAGKPSKIPMQQFLTRRKRDDDSEPELKRRLEKMKAKLEARDKELASNKKRLLEFSGIIGSLNGIAIDYERAGPEDPSPTANVKRKIEAMEEFRKKAVLKIKALKKENKSKEVIIATQEDHIRNLEDHICDLESKSPEVSTKKTSKQSRIEKECQALRAKNASKDVKICSLEARLGHLVQCQKATTKEMKLRKSYKSLKDSNETKDSRIASLEAKIYSVTKSLSKDEANSDLVKDANLHYSPRSETLESIEEEDETESITEEESLTAGSAKFKNGQGKLVEATSPLVTPSIRAFPASAKHMEISVYDDPIPNMSPLTFFLDEAWANSTENGNLVVQAPRPPIEALSWPKLSHDNPDAKEQGSHDGSRQITSRMQQLNEKYQNLNREHEAALAKIEELKKIDDDYNNLFRDHKAALSTIEELQKIKVDLENSSIEQQRAHSLLEQTNTEHTNLRRDYKEALATIEGLKLEIELILELEESRKAPPEQAEVLPSKMNPTQSIIEFEKLKREHHDAVKKYDELRRSHVGVVRQLAAVSRSNDNTSKSKEQEDRGSGVSAVELSYRQLGEKSARTLVESSRHYEKVKHNTYTLMNMLENTIKDHESTITKLQQSTSQYEAIDKECKTINERVGTLEQEKKQCRVHTQLLSRVLEQRSVMHDQAARDQKEAVAKIGRLQQAIDQLGDVKQKFEAEEEKVAWLELELEDAKELARLSSTKRNSQEEAQEIIVSLKRDLKNAAHKADETMGKLEQRDIELHDIIGRYRQLHRDHDQVVQRIRQLEKNVAFGKKSLEEERRENEAAETYAADDTVHSDSLESEQSDLSTQVSSPQEPCESVLLRLQSIETMAQAIRTEAEEASELREASKEDLLMVLRHFQNLKQAYNAVAVRENSKDHPSCSSSENESMDNHDEESSQAGDNSVAESFVTTETVESGTNAIELVYKGAAEHSTNPDGKLSHKSTQSPKQDFSAEQLKEKYMAAQAEIKLLEKSLEVAEQLTREYRSKQEQVKGDTLCNKDFKQEGHSDNGSSSSVRNDSHLESKPSNDLDEQQQVLILTKSNIGIEFDFDKEDHEDHDEDDKSLMLLVERAQLRYAELETKYLESNAQIEVLEQKVTTAERDALEARRLLGLREDNYRDVITKHKKLQHQFLQTEARSKELELHMDAAKKEIRKAEYEAVNTRRRLAAAHHQYKELQGDYQAAVEEMEGMENELIEAKFLASLGNGEELLAEKKKLAKELESIKTTLSACLHEAEDLSTKNKKLLQEKETIEAKLQTSLAEGKELLIQKERLFGKNQLIEAKLAVSLDKGDELSAENKRLLREKEAIEAKLRTSLAEGKEIMIEKVRLTEKNQSIEAKLSDSLVKGDELLAEKKRLLQEKEIIETKLRTSLDKEEKLLVEKESLMKENELIEAKLVESLVKENELLAEKRRLRQEKEKTETKIQTGLEKKDVILKEKKRLIEEKNSIKAKLLASLSQTDELLADKKRLVKENAEIKSVCEELLAMMETQGGGAGGGSKT